MDEAIEGSWGTPSDEPAFRPISIRYEGLVADVHEMELGQLGESLQGFAKVLAASANYIATGQPYVHYDALQVRVYAREVQEHRCYEIMAVVKPIVESKELWAALAGGMVVGAMGLFVPVLTYILSKRKSDEMKYLNEALQKSIAGNQSTSEKLVNTIDKLADALTPSIRKALAPIEKSCSSIDLYDGTERIERLDADTKAAFAVGRSRISDHGEVMRGRLVAFDISTGVARVQLDLANEPTAARVLDPAFAEANNPYANALANQQPLQFVAKVERDSEGMLTKLHILDTSEEPSG